MPDRSRIARIGLLISLGAAVSLAACAPSPAAVAENPAGGIAQATDALPTFPQTIVRPTPTTAIPPARTPMPTNTVSPAATQTAAEIVLPGWVPAGARARLGRGKINAVALSPDGGSLAVAGVAGLFLYRSDSFEEIWSVPTDQGMEKVVFSADGRKIATVTACIQYPHYPIEGGGDGDYCDNTVEVIVWEAADAGVIQRMTPGSDRIKAIGFSEGGEALYVYGSLQGLTLWDVPGGKRREDFRIERSVEGYPAAVAFSNDMKLMAESFWGGQVVLSDPADGTILRQWSDDEKPAGVLAFSGDNSILAGGRTWESTLALWNVESGVMLRELGGSAGRVSATAFSSTGKVILAGFGSGDVVQWSVDDGHCQRVYSGLGGAVRSVLFLPEARNMLAAMDAALLSYDSVTGKPLPMPEMPFSDWSGVRWQPEGRELALERDGTVGFWNTEDFSFSRSLSFPPGSVISPDYGMYAEASSGGDLVISYASGGKRIAAMKIPDYLYDSSGHPLVTSDTLTISPDAGILGTSASNYKVLMDSADLWDVRNGSFIRRLTVSSSGSISNRSKLVFSSDGRLAALAVFDGSGEFGESITIFESSTGEKKTSFWNVLEWKFALSSDNASLITGCAWKEGPGSVCVYDISTGKRRLAYSQEFFPINREADAISSLSLSPGGAYAAAGTLWGNVLVWDGREDRLRRTFRGHTISVSSLSFSPDERMLASAGGDGSVVVWNI